MTPDPYQGSANPGNPQSWNRYAYVNNDPINKNDPRGLNQEWPWDEGFDPFDPGFPCPGYAGCGWDAMHGRWGGSSSIGNSGTSSDPSPGGGVVAGPKVVDPTNSGPYQDLIEDSLFALEQTIDPDCASYLGGIESVNKLIDWLRDRKNLSAGHALITPNTINAITDFVSRGITINRTGAFFDSTNSTDNGRINGNSPRARIFIFLHEFGHIQGAVGFLSDYNNPDAGRQNNNLIHDHCKNTMNRFGNRSYDWLSTYSPDITKRER